MATGLTPKQEAFARAVAAGATASDAYRQAYSTAKMSAKTVNEAACRLMRDGKVSARVAALQQKAAEQTELTAQWVIERLMKEAGLDDSPPGARINALGHLGKVAGIFEKDNRQRAAIVPLVDANMTPEDSARAYLALVRGVESA